MLKKIAAIAIVGVFATATAATAQVSGGNELSKNAKMKGGMMGKSHMKKMHHHSMKKTHKGM